MPKKWIVGLGNPGKKYEQSRHNAGFMAVHLYAAQEKLVWQKDRNESLWLRTDSGGQKLYLVLPQTYMNDSGRSLLSWKSKEGLEAADMIVVYDDMDLPLGKLRFRASGSGGSHNGMASIIESLGTDQFARLRIGIGKPENPEDWPDYVLRRFSQEESAVLKEVLAKAAAALSEWAQGASKDQLMQKYNA